MKKFLIVAISFSVAIVFLFQNCSEGFLSQTLEESSRSVQTQEIIQTPNIMTSSATTGTLLITKLGQGHKLLSGVPFTVSVRTQTSSGMYKYFPASGPFQGKLQLSQLTVGDYEVGLQSLIGYHVSYAITQDGNIPPTNYPFTVYNATLHPLVVPVSRGKITYLWVKVLGPSQLINLNQVLACNISGAPVGPSPTETLSFQGHHAVVDVGINRQLGGIPVSLKILPRGSSSNPLEIIDNISATGAGWQTSLVINNGSYQGAFNQAAGNRTRMWGYNNRYSSGPLIGFNQIVWNPLFSDQHEYGTILTSPCYGNSTRFSDGKGSIVPTYSPDGILANTKVVTLKNSYQYKFVKNQNFTQFDVDQAFYLNGAAVVAANLRVYYHIIGSGNVVGPIDPWLLKDPSAGWQTLKDSKKIFNYFQDNLIDKYFVSTPYIDYAVLVWTVGGKDILMGLRNTSPSSLRQQSFRGLFSIHRYPWCKDSNDFSKCYNVQFHSILDQLTSKTVNTGDILDYGLSVTFGSREQLINQGFSLPTNL